MLNILNEYHAKVRLLYFFILIVISMSTGNPLWVSLSFLFASFGLIQLKGFQFYIKRILGFLPVLILLIVMNVLFNSRGLTVLFSLAPGKPVTLEVLLYSFFSGLSLLSVLLWFFAFHHFIKSDDVLELLAERVPTVGLILSMIMRYIPDTLKIGQEIRFGQTAFLGKKQLDNKENRHFIVRMFTILLSISMENALQTADSLQSKQYPSPQRKTYLRQHFSGTDLMLTILLGFLGATHIVTLILGAADFSYYPFINWTVLLRRETLYATSLLSFILLAILPYVLKIVDSLRWHRLLKREKHQADQVKCGLVIYE
jgi:energy-coupling factor transport system permease protein